MASSVNNYQINKCTVMNFGLTGILTSLFSFLNEKNVLFTSPGAQQSPPVAAQDLTSIIKAGYLEKRRKGQCFTDSIHSKAAPF